MRKDKEIAVELRRLGKSYRQIRDELKIPLSTLSDWFKDIEWSQALAKELSATAQVDHTKRIIELDRVRGLHLERVYKEARGEAAKEFESLKYNPLFIAGMMLYWGEGAKALRHQVSLANTDAAMIRLFVTFLTEVGRIPLDRIRARVLIYPDLEERTCRGYWAKQSAVPWENFMKSVAIQGRHKTRRLNWGVCTVLVSSSYFAQKVAVWLDLLPPALMDKGYYDKIGLVESEV